jgi:hypothetical protein
MLYVVDASRCFEKIISKSYAISKRKMVCCFDTRLNLICMINNSTFDFDVVVFVVNEI